MKPTQPTTPDGAHSNKIHPNCEERRAIRFNRVRQLVPLGASRIYELIATQKFPKPFTLVEGGRAVAWWEHEIYEWLDRAAASRGEK